MGKWAVCRRNYHVMHESFASLFGAGRSITRLFGAFTHKRTFPAPGVATYLTRITQVHAAGDTDGQSDLSLTRSGITRLFERDAPITTTLEADGAGGGATIRHPELGSRRRVRRHLLCGSRVQRLHGCSFCRRANSSSTGSWCGGRARCGCGRSRYCGQHHDGWRGRGRRFSGSSTRLRCVGR